MLDVWTESSFNHHYIIIRISCKDDICIDFSLIIFCRGGILFHSLWSPALEEAENFFAVVTLVLLEECRVLKMNNFALFVKNYKYGVAEA